MRGRRVVQILPALLYGDAVGNDVLALDRMLRDEGLKTGIYSEMTDGRIPKGVAKSIDLYNEAESDVIIYHMAAGSRLNREVTEYPGRKVMIYHNITPCEYFISYDLGGWISARSAREDLRYMADKFDLVIADSEYNREDLISEGYSKETEVCPIIIPFSDYDREPDRELMKQYGNDGVTNILFTGRVVPNKKQENVIRLFYCYRNHYDRNSRLILAGSCIDRYRHELEDYIHRLGLEESVLFTGHISFDKLLAWYRLADAFVCMSEHEGFCVPIVEAMYFGLPIVALRSTAVTDTLGDGGILLPDNDPKVGAGVLSRLLNDKELQDELRGNQKDILERLSYDNVRRRMIECLKRVL